MIDTKLDCRGSNFKGLDIPNINDVLSKVINKEIEFISLGSTCKEIKKIRSLKDEFVRLVGASSWEAVKNLILDMQTRVSSRENLRESPFPKICQLWYLSAKRL